MAAMLTEAAQDQRNVSRASDGENEPAEETAPRDEIRSYRFSPLAIHCEQELFEDQGAQNLREVFFTACSSLTAFTAVLEKIDAEAELEGAAPSGARAEAGGESAFQNSGCPQHD